MIKFNSTNIIVGYIKEMLKSFNLPIDGSTENYIDKFIPNVTKHLDIKSIYYDGYTHRYLGDYLRFLRDYYKLDLMQLYNCYSDEYVKDLALANMKYDTDMYKYIAVKVIPNQIYTIAIECLDTYELGYCYVDANNQYYNSATSNIIHKSSRYHQPYTIKVPNVTGNKNALRMIIKLPKSNNSSITILEGDYRHVNDFIYEGDKENVVPNNTTDMMYTQYTNGIKVNPIRVYNCSDIGCKDNDTSRHIKSSSQLLAINSGISYPFADRLIEYITGNAITKLDNISDNITRLQAKLASIYANFKPKYKGIWEDNYSSYIYNKINSYQTMKNKYDCLGYVDKDVESMFGADIDIYEEE